MSVLYAALYHLSSEQEREEVASTEDGTHTTPPQPRHQEATYSIYIVGDAGHLNPSAAALLRATLREYPAPSQVLFLGDNIYPSGLRPPEHPQYQADIQKLYAQINAVQGLATASLFVPGNHDWRDFGHRDFSNSGVAAVVRQQNFLTTALGPNAFAPKGACPGPSLQKFYDMTVVAIDTQWLLYDEKVKKGLTDDCVTTNDDFYLHFRKLLPESGAILVGHHPLESDGKHGREVKPDCTQGIGCAPYQKMIAGIKAGLKDRPAFICAAGHDHSLQVLKGDEFCKYYLVSGAMSHTTSLFPSERQFYGSRDGGFLRLDFYESGAPLVRAFTLSSGPLHAAFSMELR